MISFALITMLGVAVVGCQKEPIVEPSGNDTVVDTIVEPELVSLTGSAWEGYGLVEIEGRSMTIENELEFYTDSTGYYKVWYIIGPYTSDPLEYAIGYEFDGVSSGRGDIYDERGEISSQFLLIYEIEGDILTLVLKSTVPYVPDTYCELHRRVSNPDR